MINSEPLVSIIITSYNYAKYIGKTIQSVLDQTYENWELFVSDDCSTDNSLEIIKSFKDPRIKLITNTKNQGAYEAYTRAFELCSGKYFVSLDSDDYMHPSRIAKQVSYLENNKDIDILGTFIYEIDENGKVKRGKSVFTDWFNIYIDLNDPKNWVWGNRLCHSSVMIRTEIHKNVGSFNKELIYSPDYEFWLRCLGQGTKVQTLKNKLTFYRSHGTNITNSNPVSKFYEILYINIKHVSEVLEEEKETKGISLVIDGLTDHSVYKSLSLNEKGKVLQIFFAKIDFKSFTDFTQKLKSINSNEAFEALAYNLDRYQTDLEWYKRQLGSHQKALRETSENLENLTNLNTELKKPYILRITKKVRQELLKDRWKFR